MQERLGDHVFDDSLDAFDFGACHALLTRAYWSPGITRVEVEHGFRHSTLVAGAYLGERQVGCARVVSDRTRFAFVMDVIVEEAQRGRGLGRALVRFLLGHPELTLVYRMALVTNDAHGVYAKLGFQPLAHPERWMTLEKQRDWLEDATAPSKSG